MHKPNYHSHSLSVFIIQKVHLTIWTFLKIKVQIAKPKIQLLSMPTENTTYMNIIQISRGMNIQNNLVHESWSFHLESTYNAPTSWTTDNH